MKKIFNILPQVAVVIEGNNTPAATATEEQDRLSAMIFLTEFCIIFAFVFAVQAVVHFIAFSLVGVLYALCAIFFSRFADKFMTQLEAYDKEVKEKHHSGMLKKTNALHAFDKKGN